MNPAPFQAKSRQEVLQALARHPASVAEYHVQHRQVDDGGGVGDAQEF